MRRPYRRTFTRFFTALGIGSCYLWLILQPKAASAAAASALKLCAQVIVPSLFPFFVCANLFCALELMRPLERALRRVMEPVFGVPGAGAAALVLGLTGGYPSGAQAVGTLYCAGSIDMPQAGRLLFFCNNCGPAFIFGVVGGAVFKSVPAGFLLYLVHIFSALLCGAVRRGKPASRKEMQAASSAAPGPVSFSAALTESVRKAGQTALEVCMFVIVFGVLAAMVQQALAPFLPPALLVFLSGVLELSGGAAALAALSAPQSVKFIAASFFLAFGGLSVHAQTKAVLRQAGLEGLPVFFPKLLHACVSALLSIPVYALFAPALQTAQTFAPAPCTDFFAVGNFALCAGLCLVFRKMAGSIFAQNRV